MKNTLAVVLLLLGVNVGSAVADSLGPAAWRSYWTAGALLTALYAVVLWRRLGRPRMAAGAAIAACSIGSFGFLGSGRDEVNAAMAGGWMWFVGALVAVVLLFAWEGRRAQQRS